MGHVAQNHLNHILNFWISDEILVNSSLRWKKGSPWTQMWVRRGGGGGGS